MSLYNALFGHNPFAPFYLSTLGLCPDDVGRFRDCFLRKDPESGEERIVIYTRNGGGNRDSYEETIEKLRAHPEFVIDFDDDFDCTYASFVFKVPEKFKEKIAAISDLPHQHVNPGERFKELLTKLQSGNMEDPEVRHAVEVGKKILEPIIEQLNAPPKKES